MAVSTLLLGLQPCAGFLVLPRRLLASSSATAAAGWVHHRPLGARPRTVPAAAGLGPSWLGHGPVSRLHAQAPAEGEGGGGGGSSSSSTTTSTAAAAAAAAPTAAGEAQATAAKKKPKQQQQQQQQKLKPARPPRGTNLLIVGLGNPGKDYSMTRHNAGFLVVDELARRLGADMKLRSAFQGEYGSATFQGKSIGLLKPTTYMNNSGQSVRKVLDYFKLPQSAVLVVVDEVALELGQIRLRQTGSPGGHNGLKSIEGHLKSKDYNRLRVGVGGAAPGKMVDHVLGEFSRSERKVLDEVLADSCDAVEDWILDDDTDKVMNRVNAPRK